MKNDINYGFDAPAIMRNLIIFGIVLPLIGFLVMHYIDNTIVKYLCYFIIFIGFILLILGTSMFGYGTWGKLVMRDYMLGKITWKGDEQVLDIGAGTGF